MAQHPNTTTIDRMTQAALDGDAATLSEIFTEDMVFHVRGTLPSVGDHRGASGFLGVIGSIVEITKGDLKLDQQFAIADGDWAAEWERAVFGRDGKTLEQYNSFVYRFEDGRIAEMWMIGAGNPNDVAFFA
ncbi:MAG TPA: nuclear transport factor 2 family protein [Actinomycetota bacterium]